MAPTATRPSSPSTTGVDAAEARGWVERVGRYGWAAKGVVYLLLGLLAFRVATGGSDEEASRQGAVDTLAEQPFGTALLVALVAGLVLYAAWRLVTAVGPGGTDGEALAKRAAWAGSALVYLALAATAVGVLAGGGEASSGSGGGSGGSGPQAATAPLLETGWGRWVVGAAGLAAIVGALFIAKQGLEEEFRQQLDEGRMPSWLRRIEPTLGKVGHLGKAVTVALIGIFLVQAAWQFDPQEAKGLDAALREVADTGWGTVVVIATGIALAAYGLYSLATAPYHRLERP